MGGLPARAYMGGCLTARPKSPLVPPYSPHRETADSPGSQVVISAFPPVIPAMAEERPDGRRVSDSTPSWKRWGDSSRRDL